MEPVENKGITVQATIDAPVETVWKCWTSPEDIVNWNNASDDWHSPRAENDVETGGRFNIRMEARDGSEGFDFYGVYDKVKPNKYIGYTMGDGRKVIVVFTPLGTQTEVVETFEPEETNPLEMQRYGWQSILNNFKKYTEHQVQLSSQIS